MWPIVTCLSFCDCFRVCPSLLRYGARLNFVELEQFWRSAIVQVRNHLEIWNDITNQIIGLLADACMAWICTGKNVTRDGTHSHSHSRNDVARWVVFYSLKRCRCTNNTLCIHSRSKICSVTKCIIGRLGCAKLGMNSSLMHMHDVSLNFATGLCWQFINVSRHRSLNVQVKTQSNT